MRESVKSAKKRNLACIFKHMTIVFNSKQFKTIICTKWFRMQSVMPNKPSVDYYMRESANNTLKTSKTQLSK